MIGGTLLSLKLFREEHSDNIGGWWILPYIKSLHHNIGDNNIHVGYNYQCAT